MTKKSATFSIDEKTLLEFKKLCKREAYNMSGLMEKMMREFIDNKKNDERHL